VTRVVRRPCRADQSSSGTPTSTNAVMCRSPLHKKVQLSPKPSVFGARVTVLSVDGRHLGQLGTPHLGRRWGRLPRIPVPPQTTSPSSFVTVSTLSGERAVPGTGIIGQGGRPDGWSVQPRNRGIAAPTKGRPSPSWRAFRQLSTGRQGPGRRQGELLVLSQGSFMCHVVTW
jgi:hypothetical protein